MYVLILKITTFVIIVSYSHVNTITKLLQLELQWFEKCEKKILFRYTVINKYLFHIVKKALNIYSLHRFLNCIFKTCMISKIHFHYRNYFICKILLKSENLQPLSIILSWYSFCYNLLYHYNVRGGQDLLITCMRNGEIIISLLQQNVLNMCTNW